MIKKEIIEVNGRTLYKTYHETFRIKQTKTGIVYDEAIDTEEKEYILTDELTKRRGEKYENN